MSVPKIGFCFEVPNISRLETIWSPAVFVRGVPWKIVVKKFDETKRTLGVYLQCEKEDTSTNWSYVASATFKLQSLKDKVKAVEYQISPCVFDKALKNSGDASFIEWDDLIDTRKGYVKNDTMNLDIIIEVADPNDPNKSGLIFKNSHKSCRDDCVAKFDLTITSVRSLMAVKSPKFTVRDIPCNFIVYKHKDLFDVRLVKSAHESHNRMMLVKLLSTKGDEKSVVQAHPNLTQEFIAWNELLKPENGFISNNSIKLEITIVAYYTIQSTRSYLQAMTSSISVPRFCVEVPRIGGLNRIVSSEVMIRGVPWYAQVCKKIVDGKWSLIVYLHCAKPVGLQKYSYIASSSIKLLSFNENVEAVDCHNVPNVFDNDEFGYGDPLIGWDDLFDVEKCYVKNDMITLDIKIDVADPNDENKSRLIFKDISNGWREDYRKYQLAIENIESLVAVKSQQFSMRNFSWNLLVYRHQSYLGVGLFFYGDDSCTRTMMVKLFPTKTKGKLVEQVVSKNFQAFEETYTDKFISWDELLKPENGFVSNYSIMLEVTIAANIEDAQDSHRPTAPMLEPEHEREKSKSDCPICLENMNERGALSIPCGHLFCSPCITNILESSPVCPLCRSPAKLNEIRRIYL